MAFPTTQRYFIVFGPTDVGLAPTFTDPLGNPAYLRADTFAAVAAPVINAVLNAPGGRYYFDVIWNAETDPDILAMVDGGLAVVVPEVRWQTLRLSAKPFAAVTATGGGGGGTITVG